MSGSLSKYGGYTRYMSADTARVEEFDRLITNRLKEIGEKNEILRGFKRLSDENRIDQVLNRYEELWKESWMDVDKLYDYLQQELNVTFNMRDKDLREKKLGDALFYYLLRDEEPVREIQQLIEMIRSGFRIGRSWYGICAPMLRQNIIFTQFYKQLGSEPQHVEYLIYKHPQLLFNKYSQLLINTLNKHLPHDNLHQILLNTRDDNGQPFIFYIANYIGMLPVDVYRNKFNDVCELLSVRNKDGQTALHMNGDIAYKLLLTRITLNNQDKVNKLLSIRDNNNKTVYDTTDDWHKERLTWLTRQYKHNNYPLYNRPRVLILYNTKDRQGAEDEAESIQQAFNSVTSSVKLEKMGTKREVLQLIAQQADDWDTSALIVCLMSHGNIGTIDDSKKNPITLTSIEGAMCSDQLKEQPKILITQSCQTRAAGRKYRDKGACSSTDRPSADAFVANIPYVPVADNFLSVQSCRSAHECNRNYFISYLAQQINDSSKNNNFEDLVKNVSCKMLGEGNEQIPIVQSTLRGKVCLKDRCWGLN